MLTIRDGQLDAMAGVARARFVRDMVPYLRASFPEAMGAFDDRQLEGLIARAVAEAARHDLRTARLVGQFLNLCVIYGWDFLKEPQHRWMIDDYLGNRAISDPRDRLALLVDQCVCRLRAEETNRRVAERFLPPDDDDDGDLDEDAANVPLLGKR